MGTLRAIDCLFTPPVKQPEFAPGQATLGGLPCPSQVDDIARDMPQQGIERVLLTPCQAGGAACERQYLCDDAVANELLHHVQRYPTQFAALAGFNPHDLEHSVAHLDATLRRGLSGLFVDPCAIAAPLLDRRMYPAYAKCSERHAPVMIVIRPNIAAGMRSSIEELLVLAGDFPQLCIVAAFETWPRIAELQTACESRDNLYFALDGKLSPKEAAETIAFLTSDSSTGRCLWGSNGEAWNQALARIAALNLPAEARQRFLRDNAGTVFHLAQRVDARPFELKTVLTAE